LPTFRGTPRLALNSTTTSGSPSTKPWRRPPTTSAVGPIMRLGGPTSFGSPQPFEMPGRNCLLQVDGRAFLTYSVCPWSRVDWRFLLLPRSHRPRSTRGMGRAQGPQRVGSFGHARLRIV